MDQRDESFLKFERWGADDPGVLRRLRSFDAITSWSIEVPDCSKR